jgi:hypothetical protein
MLCRFEVDARAQLGEVVTALARVPSIPDRLHAASRYSGVVYARDIVPIKV